jgi:predicted nucleic acid-binding protein
MGHKSTAVYDACVLYSNHLRDVLMQLAVTGLFRAKWTEQIHDEWMCNLLENRPDINPDKLQRLRQAMDRAVPDCLVAGFESIVPALNLPDPDDRHVLAAAIIAEANVIVTVNLKDFPADTLSSYGIKAQHPDSFIAELIDLEPRRVRAAIQTIQSRLKHPPVSFDDYMEVWMRQGLTTSASKLQQLQDEGD